MIEINTAFDKKNSVLQLYVKGSIQTEEEVESLAFFFKQTIEEDNFRYFLIDWRQIEYIIEEGLSYFFSLALELRACKGQMVFWGPNIECLLLAEFFHLTDFIPHFNNLREAYLYLLNIQKKQTLEPRVTRSNKEIHYDCPKCRQILSIEEVGEHICPYCTHTFMVEEQEMITRPAILSAG